MSESIKRREEVLREVRRHIEHYKVAWDRIGRYGGSGRAALDVLEDISQREGDIPSMDDTEEVEEAEAEIKHLREILKTLDNHDKIEPLFAEQEKQMREVYAIQANCTPATVHSLTSSPERSFPCVCRWQEGRDRHSRCD
ncbi:RHTO0S18e02894g1_1 [Rhodotorula toruloides]|uniref:RHTO0S18e02894g1_1 n=1 Tax=Rhodotorula toruloides TaxID=5286 RepID=A0A061BGQ8_RHOTO|nr:RHTO0S18e02894g1_1 [Rhodotorula toruloides]